jgi:SAM-dependent methyltransferase
VSAVDPQLRAHYDAYYGSAELAEWRRLGAIDKAQNIVDLCKGLSVATVLDIGCGDGSIIQRLGQLGFGRELHGVDLSASAIAAARAKTIAAPSSFATFDGSTLPFESGRFDLAVLSHVVEHLEHPRVLVREAARVARNVVIEVPCEHTIRLRRDYAPAPVGHINFYTPKTIRRLVQTCDLTVAAQLTRGSSLAVMRFDRPWLGVLQFLLREATLRVAPGVAPAIFVYHSALLCRSASGR